jgi:hypothetical protein
MNLIKTIAAIAFIIAGTAATADTIAPAAAAAKHAALYSSEGTKIGNVDSIVIGSDGALAAIKIIYRGKFLTLSSGTLKTTEKGLQTSLTRAELAKM